VQTRVIRPRAVPNVVTGAALAALPLVYFVDPNTTKVPLCPLHAATGLWCPLCGATRATHALLHGDVSTALHDNALYVLAIPLLLVLWWRWYRDYGSARVTRLIPAQLIPALIALTVVFGVVRNLPIGSLLAPPG
jgi:hypothetical protein